MSSTDPNATVLSRTTSRVLGPAVRQREFTLPAGNYRFEVVAINGIGTGPAVRPLDGGRPALTGTRAGAIGQTRGIALRGSASVSWNAFRRSPSRT